MPQSKSSVYHSYLVSFLIYNHVPVTFTYLQDRHLLLFFNDATAAFSWINTLPIQAPRLVFLHSCVFHLYILSCNPTELRKMNASPHSTLEDQLRCLETGDTLTATNELEGDFGCQDIMYECFSIQRLGALIC